MKYELEKTETYIKWFDSLKDRMVKIKILARLARLENGNFGDHKSLKKELFELRSVFGGGVRVYYTIQHNKIVLLLSGGVKDTQSKDITKARQLLNELE